MTVAPSPFPSPWLAQATQSIQQQAQGQPTQPAQPGNLINVGPTPEIRQRQRPIPIPYTTYSTSILGGGTPLDPRQQKALLAYVQMAQAQQAAEKLAAAKPGKV